MVVAEYRLHLAPLAIRRDAEPRRHEPRQYTVPKTGRQRRARLKGELRLVLKGALRPRIQCRVQCNPRVMGR